MTPEAAIAMTPQGHVADAKLADSGVNRIEWAEREMPVLRQIKARFAKEKPLKGRRIAACLHVTTETANLMLTLQAGGAEVALCASNPLSTQDDVAAALMHRYQIPTFAIKGENADSYYQHINAALDLKPEFTMDDGADLVTVLHTKRPDQAKQVIAGTEETTTGVIRLRSMARDGALRYPVLAVNDAKTKHFFDNRYGTGPEHHRRRSSGDKPPPRGLQVRRAGLRLVRPGPGEPGEGDGGPRGGHRDRSAARAGSGDGRI